MAPKGKKDKKKPPTVELKPAKDQKPKKPPPPPACFTPELIQQFKELFKLYDEANIDKVVITMIPTMLRKLGFNPTKEQIQILIDTFIEDEFADMVEFWEFLFMIERKIQWGDDFEAKVVESFKNLGHDDENTGFVNMAFLTEMLFTWGEPFEEKEFVDLVRLAKKDKTFTPADGLFKYETFVENMNRKDVRFLPEPVNYFKMDQHALAALAMEKARLAAEEAARKEEERLAREEARRQRMIAEGFIVE